MVYVVICCYVLKKNNRDQTYSCPERSASLGIMGTPIKGPLETPICSEGGLLGNPPNYADRRLSLEQLI